MKKSKWLLILMVMLLMAGCSTGNNDSKDETKAESTAGSTAGSTSGTSSGGSSESGSGASTNPASGTSAEVADYVLDLSKLTVWDGDKGNTYNTTSHELYIVNQFSGAQFWFGGFDASSYKYVEVTYETSGVGFSISTSYMESETVQSSGQAYRFYTTAYVELDSAYKGKIKMVYFQNPDKEPLKVTLKDLRFTQKKKEYAPVEKITDDKGTVQISDSLTARELVKEMKAGWNLGNTLDANSTCLLSSETCWGEPKTTKEIIHIGKASGYKTIRIPVTWHNHIVDDKYSIDPDWMRRVKEVVDWAIADGYYVILNEHHSVHDNMNSPLKYKDGYIVRNNETDIAESKAFLKAVWTQIATAFNSSYDEHLIFETMNEPRNTSHEHQWQPGQNLGWCNNSNCSECQADYKILNEYNQVCLDAIRSSGGNNKNRFVMIPSLCTSESTPNHELFRMPSDSAKEKLILTIHSYIMGVSEANIKMEYSAALKNEVNNILGKLNSNYVQKGIPVVVGEVGAWRKIPQTERIKWITHFGETASSYGMSVVYWECGKAEDNSFSIFDRQNACVRPEEKAFADAFVTALK